MIFLDWFIFSLLAPVLTPLSCCSFVLSFIFQAILAVGPLRFQNVLFIHVHKMEKKSIENKWNENMYIFFSSLVCWGSKHIFFHARIHSTQAHFLQLLEESGTSTVAKHTMDTFLNNPVQHISREFFLALFPEKGKIQYRNNLVIQAWWNILSKLVSIIITSFCHAFPPCEILSVYFLPHIQTQWPPPVDYVHSSLGNS